jgi:hypothetical protein
MPRTDLTTSRHLLQTPRFRSSNGRWHFDFHDAQAAVGNALTWDVAGLQSLGSFLYPCADRTLFREISRQPWISRIDDSGHAVLEEIPNHGLQWAEPNQIAAELRARLNSELLSVCRGRKHIYLLLSGGLDSRIVAGALGEAYRSGNLETKPVGVTWGFEDSRDVVYAREVARVLEFDWVHIPARQDALLDNVEAIAKHLGALTPALDIHRALWFRDVETDALVLAGSYGDSVGRGEFSKRTVLDLDRHEVRDAFHLLKPEFAAAGGRQLTEDFAALYRRKPDPREYTHREHEQQCHYMRGLYGLGLSIVGRFCDIYQMFTAPEVYGFMWSLHPAVRTDEPYFRLLAMYDEKLARLPWARTNRGVAGRTQGAVASLRPAYHDHAGSVRGPLYGKLRDLVDPAWFADTGVFDPAAVARLDAELRSPSATNPARQNPLARTYLWLATVRRCVDLAAENGISLKPPVIEDGQTANPLPPPRSPGRLRAWLRSRKRIFTWVKKRKARRLRQQSVRLYPPTSFSPE